MLATALFLATVLVIPFGFEAHPFQANPPQATQAKFLEAFKAVQAASHAGATNSELSKDVSDLNEALSLMKQAQELNRLGKSVDANNVAQQSISLLVNVESSAVAMQGRAQARTQSTRVLDFTLAPIFSLLVVFCFHYGSYLYRRYRTARMMKMRIRVKNNERQKAVS